MVVTTIRSVYVEDVLAVSAVSLAPFAPRLRKRLSSAYATSVYTAAHRGTATRAASKCRGVPSYRGRSTVPTFGPLGATRRTMSGTGASTSRANADGSTSFSSRAATSVGQNPKAAASSQRPRRDSRATDFIRPVLGKRPRIAVQPPSTMPSLLTMRSYRAFVRTSTLALELEQPRLRSLCGPPQDGSVPASAPQCQVVGSMNPAVTRSTQCLAISSTSSSSARSPGRCPRACGLGGRRGSHESGRPGSNRRRPAWEAFLALAGQGFFGGGSRNGITQYLNDPGRYSAICVVCRPPGRRRVSIRPTRGSALNDSSRATTRTASSRAA